MRNSASEKSRVCRRASAVAAAVALGVVPAAAASNPVPALYNDFASDGVLSCHSKADLRAVLADATLQQYGDPSTMIGLKLAAHKQLAGGCGQSRSSTPPGSSGSTADRQRGTSQATHSKKGDKNDNGKRAPRTAAAPPRSEASGVDGPTDKRMLLGTGLLLLTLATGGWAARRAFNGKR
jgi:hypothetical protein